MPTITWPQGLPLTGFRLEQFTPAIASESALSGTVQVVGNGVPLWRATVEFHAQVPHQAEQVEALFMRLRGRTNDVAMPMLHRPVPLGTARGTPTLGAAAARGATSAVINAGAGQAGNTYRLGDFLGITLVSGRVQLVRLVDPLTLNGSGSGTVVFEPPLRTAANSGAVVLWNAPTTRFLLDGDTTAVRYSNGLALADALTLREVL